MAQPCDEPFDRRAGLGGRDLKIGTVRGAIRQLGLDWSAFESA